MNIKELKNFVNKLPSEYGEYDIYYERIEDDFFNKHGWKPLKVDCKDMPLPDGGYIQGDFIYVNGVYIQDKKLLITGHY